MEVNLFNHFNNIINLDKFFNVLFICSMNSYSILNAITKVFTCYYKLTKRRWKIFFSFTKRSNWMRKKKFFFYFIHGDRSRFCYVREFKIKADLHILKTVLTRAFMYIRGSQLNSFARHLSSALKRQRQLKVWEPLVIISCWIISSSTNFFSHICDDRIFNDISVRTIYTVWYIFNWNKNLISRFVRKWWIVSKTACNI